MPRTALLLAPLLLLGALVPAATAQEPTPAATGTPPPDARCAEASLSGPSSVRPGQPFEVRASVTDGSRPDLSLVRLSPEPVEVLRETAAATATTSWTLSLDRTSRLGLRATRQAGCSLYSSGLHVTVGSSPPPSVSCPGVDITEVVSDGRVGGTTTVTATRYGGPPGTRMVLRRLRPAPDAVVREQSDTATTVTWTLRLGETHVVQVGALYDRSACWALGRPDQPPVTLGVRAAVTLAAARTGVRDYVFSGRVVPARGQTVELYRVDPGGRRLTARGAVDADGTYRVPRRFLASGRFGVVAVVPTSATNDRGASPVRPTVVH